MGDIDRVLSRHKYLAVSYTACYATQKVLGCIEIYFVESASGEVQLQSIYIKADATVEWPLLS